MKYKLKTLRWMKIQFNVQWKPLSVITLDKIKSDNINEIKTITDDFHLVPYYKWVVEI